MRKSDLLKKKKVPLNSKHIEYNTELLNDIQTVRYHVVAVGFPSDRNQVLREFLEQVTKISALDDYKEVSKGKVKGGPLEYKCVSFSANVKLSEINRSEIKVPLVRDENLREKRRKGQTLEIYVDNKYS